MFFMVISLQGIVDVSGGEKNPTQTVASWHSKRLNILNLYNFAIKYKKRLSGTIMAEHLLFWEIIWQLGCIQMS